MPLAAAALAAGDVAAAQDASEAGWQHLMVQPKVAAIHIDVFAQLALACGDLITARRRADEAVVSTTGWHLSMALTTRARVAIAQGEPEQAERDAHEALALAAELHTQLRVGDALECLAGLAGDAGSYLHAARLFGAADALGSAPARCASRSSKLITRHRCGRCATR